MAPEYSEGKNDPTLSRAGSTRHGMSLLPHSRPICKGKQKSGETVLRSNTSGIPVEVAASENPSLGRSRTHNFHGPGKARGYARSDRNGYSAEPNHDGVALRAQAFLPMMVGRRAKSARDTVLQSFRHPQEA